MCRIIQWCQSIKYLGVYLMAGKKPTIFRSFLTFKLWGQLIRGSCHTARVDSQQDGYLSMMLTVCEPHTAWTISRSLTGAMWMHGREHVSGVLNDHAQTCAVAAA